MRTKRDVVVVVVDVVVDVVVAIDTGLARHETVITKIKILENCRQLQAPQLTRDEGLLRPPPLQDRLRFAVCVLKAI